MGKDWQCTEASSEKDETVEVEMVSEGRRATMRVVRRSVFFKFI